MKKILFLFVALLQMAPVLAQSNEGEDEFTASQGGGKKSTFSIGPKVGGTLTTMTQPDEGKLYDGSGIGFSGGVAMKMRFGKVSENAAPGTGYFGIGAELKYKRNTVKTVGTDEKGKTKANLSIDYFEVPVFVQVYPFAKSPTMNPFYVEAGFSFAGTMSRSVKSLTVDNPSQTISSVVYHTDDDQSKLKGGDARVLVGLGYTIPGTGLDINARYYIGTGKLAKNFPCRMNSAEVSVAWLFNAGKF